MDTRILGVIDFIHNADKRGYFAKYLHIIRQTHYVTKTKLDLFKGWNTTWGKRLVYLDPGFYNLYPATQAAVLIHEAVHCAQYEEMGAIKFWFKYLKAHFVKGYNNDPF